MAGGCRGFDASPLWFMNSRSSPFLFSPALQRGLSLLAFVILLAWPGGPEPTEVFVLAFVGLTGTVLVRRPRPPTTDEEPEEPAPVEAGQEREPEGGGAGRSAAPGTAETMAYTVWESF